ncbi:MAG: hypothetical protein AAGI38_11145 [Bacteroidota bacterium]
MKQHQAAWIVLFLGVCLSCCMLIYGCTTSNSAPEKDDLYAPLLEKYYWLDLRPGQDQLTPQLKRVFQHLQAASNEIDTLFQQESYHKLPHLLDTLPNSVSLRRLVQLNYGPYNRLDGFSPVLAGTKPRPAGAAFYPADLTPQQFIQSPDEGKWSPWSVVHRQADGELVSTPYHIRYQESYARIIWQMQKGAFVSKDTFLKQYLIQRSEAFRLGDFSQGFGTWITHPSNDLDLIIGPMDVEEDKLFGLKKSHMALVIHRMPEWEALLNLYRRAFPRIHHELTQSLGSATPLPNKEQVGVYNLLYAKGAANAGSKIIALRLPLDEELQTTFGARRILLYNVMEAKHKHILLPTMRVLLDSASATSSFDAFLTLTLLHEMAHSLGYQYTVDGKTRVRNAMGRHALVMEELKADALGLYAAIVLQDQGILKGIGEEELFQTFVGSTLRRLRFGLNHAHAKASYLTLDFLLQEKAVTYLPKQGVYQVLPKAMPTAVYKLCKKVLSIQGSGDEVKADLWLRRLSTLTPQLKADLERLDFAGIPVDLAYKQ